MPITYVIVSGSTIENYIVADLEYMKKHYPSGNYYEKPVESAIHSDKIPTSVF